MIIQTHPQFKKSYKKRISHNSKLTQKTKQRINLFLKNPDSPLLNNHQLIGNKKNLSSFSITGDIRIIYLRITPHHVLFLDIGSHNQVY